MTTLPYRTGATWLSDDHLILLDLLFDSRIAPELLRRDEFCERWNLRYSHGLSDAALRYELQMLCSRGVLSIKGGALTMTAVGGTLWSDERQPVWERFATERYDWLRSGRVIMSVLAVSPETRDQFLNLWPPRPARRRVATISGRSLVEWKGFKAAHVGVATYEDEPHGCRCEDYAGLAQQRQLRWDMLERERSWWRTVGELQKFVPRNA